jgi:hypothetical protein
MDVGRKWKYRIATLVALVFTGCGLWFAYAPSHWMTQVSWAKVKVDGRPVEADIYIGNPTYYESDAFLLVHVPDVGDYFLSFGNENYREVSSHEFMRQPRRAWTFKSMNEGHYSEPLPSRNIDEFRLSSHNHVVVVSF